MSRTEPYQAEQRKWKYILLLQDGNAYFGDTLWKVCTEMVKHRWYHWKGGEGWQD